MPDDMAVKFLEPEDNPYGALGAKAVGEPPLMYGIGVFALRNAMKAFRPGDDLTLNAPTTPKRLLPDLHRDFPVRLGAAAVDAARRLPLAAVSPGDAGESWRSNDVSNGPRRAGRERCAEPLARTTEGRPAPPDLPSHVGQPNGRCPTQRSPLLALCTRSIE